MLKPARFSLLVSFACILVWLALASPALAANEVFLSTDTAESEATYVIQFESGVKGNIDKIRITLPPGANAANAALGRLFIGDKGFEGDDDHKKDVQLSLDGPDTLVIDLKDDRSVKVGAKILVELFNLNNPVAGSHAIDVTTVNKKGNVLEVIPPIAYSTFPVGTGDITAVNTPAGSGLTGGAASGDVTLSLQNCPAGQVLKSVGSTWACAADNDTNSGGTVTNVGTGAGLTGGPITTTGTISVAAGGITGAMIQDGTVGSADVNSAQIQLRIGSSCAAGSSIRVINSDGTVTCEADDNSGGTVTAVTATAPLASSGGTTPIITLPHVKIQATNTSIGSSALLSNTTGSVNTASGANALQSNTTGNFNTASGSGALQSNTTGNFNTASGVSALHFNTTGLNNTASGASALESNTTGVRNTAIGSAALKSNTSGEGNTASGVSALAFNTTGSANTASGESALQSNTTGSVNTASGRDALRSNTTGANNTASGVSALHFNTTGNFNTASGVSALGHNTTGGSNTASGASALEGNTTGFSNTASGANALHFNNSNHNTASGANALLFNTFGNSNTASGESALLSNTTGSNNTAVGRSADVSVGNLTNATAIGNGAIVNASNKIRLGNAAVAVIEAQVGLTVVSDKTKKENFQPVDGEEVLKKIGGLGLTSWNFIGHDPKQFRHYGPMAQDFFAAFGNDGIGAIGTPTTIGSSDMAGILMIAVQALEKQNREVRAENADLKARLERLEQLINRPYLTTAAAPVVSKAEGPVQ